ncbi:MAG: histidinol-phosphate transaminase [Bacillota bacterium]|jgi:histidinol-phosphate aminotransferase|nr:histidinol-phosphate transaminase [Candidatus Fermentithermobacillaceae bacterium]
MSERSPVSYPTHPRPEVLTLSPYIPGKPADEVKRELGLERVVKLASNENPLGPSPRAMKAIEEMAASAHIYPDAAGFHLKTRLSRVYGIPTSQIVLGNGSDEVIMLLGQAFVRPGDEVVMGAQTFPVYKTSTLLMGGKPVEVPLKDGFLDLEAMASAIGPRTKLLFLCNPNNPTGTMTRKAEVHRLVEAVPSHVLVISDEAYAEYVGDEDYGTLLPHLREGKNVAVLRTFSKIYGLAGLRVGYGLMPEYAAALLDRVRLSFNQNALAQAAATAALDDREHIHQSVQVVEEGKAYLYREYAAMGLKAYPTWGNFIMLDTGKDCQAVFRALLGRGVIVRPTSAWGLHTCLRITIGTGEENEVLVAALKEALREV